MKELSEAVNVNAYIHVNFEEMGKEFQVQQCPQSSLISNVDRPQSAGWFKGTHTYTHMHEQSG